jgi:hypothetical protein
MSAKGIPSHKTDPYSAAENYSWKKLKKVEKSWKSWKRVEKQKVEIRFDSRLDGSFDLDKKMIFNVLILTMDGD